MERDSKSAEPSRKPRFTNHHLSRWIGNFTRYEKNKRTLSSLHQFIENTNGNAIRAETRLIGVAAFITYLELSFGDTTCSSVG